MIVHGQLMIDPAAPPVQGWIEISDGRICDLQEGSPAGRSDLGGSETLICPGFIDAHTHIPQFDSVGCDGLGLLEWLEKVVYPAEQRWAEVAFAHHQSERALQRMLRSGTLGFAGYLTSHEHAENVFLEAHQTLPLRAVVGRSLMDREAPSNLLTTTDAPQRMQDRGTLTDRLSLSMNPRFAISCSDDVLAACAQHSQNQCIQTHLAESAAECRRVRELFPNDLHYAGVYDRHGLLTARTLLAHCIHLSRDEWDVIAQRQSVVVHCPAANTFLRSGTFDLYAAHERGIRVALGSDVAAGPDVAMPRVARAMIEIAKLRAMSANDVAYVPTPIEAWTMITQGNADALGWREAGRLTVGAAADLLLLDPPIERDEHLIGRLMYAWDDSFIRHRFLNGQLVDLPSHRSRPPAKAT